MIIQWSVGFYLYSLKPVISLWISPWISIAILEVWGWDGWPYLHHSSYVTWPFHTWHVVLAYSIYFNEQKHISYQVGYHIKMVTYIPLKNPIIIPLWLGTSHKYLIHIPWIPLISRESLSETGHPSRSKARELPLHQQGVVLSWDGGHSYTIATLW